MGFEFRPVGVVAADHQLLPDAALQFVFQSFRYLLVMLVELVGNAPFDVARVIPAIAIRATARQAVKQVAALF